MKIFVERYSGENAHPEATPDAMFRLAALYEERARADLEDNLLDDARQMVVATQMGSTTMLQRRLPGATRARIRVDVGGYRATRRAALETFVQELITQVRDSGEERGLEPMNSSDRKVVHDTVNDADGVKTVSIGEEPRRRVVIVPDND